MALSVRSFASLAAVLVATASLVATAGASGRDTVLPSLNFDYALNCTFTVTDDSGKSVTSIAPGTYQVFVRSVVVFATVDLSGISDFTACKGFTQFQLTGPGVDVFTTLQDGDEDKDSFQATLAPSSTYTALDRLRPTVARAVLTTTGPGTTPNAPASPYVPSANAGKPTTSVDPVGSAVKKLQTRGALTATIDGAGKLFLRVDGKPLGTLKEGRYTATVTDKSKTVGLAFNLLDRSGVPSSTLTATSAAFTGKRTATLTFRKGQWNFVTLGAGKKGYFIVVGS